MKKHQNLFRRIIVLAGVFALALQASQAETIKYSELEKKIKVDRSPLESAGAAPSSYAPALEKVMPAVVTIFAKKSITLTSARNPMQEELFRRMFPDVPDDFFERFENEEGAPQRKQEGLGSGVIISSDGYILTNNHVVGDADEITVALSTNKEYEASLVGADPRTDVALIKIEVKGLEAITVGDSSKLRIGDVALAVGNPLGLEQTATVGIISGLGRNELNITNGGYENFIQTDAAINRGNSGGALVDASGRLIGINTAIQSGFSGGNIGIGFAIPSNMALNIVQRLLDDGGVVRRGFLGVFLRELDGNYAKALGREDASGVLVTEVGEDTPAESAGIKPGDLIVGYNGKKVDDMQTLRLDISNTSPGKAVEFELIRNGRERSLDVVLGDLDNDSGSIAGVQGGGRNKPAKPEELIEGVRIKDIDDETRTALNLEENVSGVIVESVKDSATAAESGLRPGMVITQIDQKDVGNTSEAYDIVEAFDSDVLLLQVYAAGRRDILAVPLTE
ncbi:MAG: Do family serine endopeptidase [Verrucomicrobiota bacterium]|nr:Do family serine endopeptidase [Verrucomicrobiota bacterium]